MPREKATLARFVEKAVIKTVIDGTPVEAEIEKEPFFAAWTNQPVVVEGDTLATAHTDTPSVNLLLDRDNTGSVMKEITLSLAGCPVYSGSGTRRIEVKDANQMTRMSLNLTHGSNGTIIEEQYATGGALLSFNADLTALPEGSYTLDISLPGATKAHARAALTVVKRAMAFTFIHTDHLGTARMVTDIDGNVVSMHDFNAFGEERTEELLAHNSHKFTGHERDIEDGPRLHDGADVQLQCPPLPPDRSGLRLQLRRSDELEPLRVREGQSDRECRSEWNRC
ncbi:MAG: hypothetical protein MZV49_13435 [Rhodopseudomonas palustris]|nr:hypothetical protein [Rhodopseudomonas palustris]